MDDHLVTSGSEAEAEAEAESPVFETRQDGRESRLGGREEPVGLVRQASLGKRSKPTLTTIKSSDSVKSPTLRSPPLSLKSVEAPQPLRTKKSQDTFGDLTASDAEASLGAARENTTERRSMRRPALSTRTNSSDAIGKASVDASASESEKSIGKQKSGELLSVRAPAARTRPKSPLSQSDPRVEEIIGGLEKGGALTPSAAETLRVPEREGSLRDAEARGSLTSLPDLIRRATKLASNLDRGRTASRLGLNMFDDIGEKGKYPEQSTDKRRSGSISDILASFPPPGLVTPGSRGSRGSKPLSHWPSSGLRHSTLPSESDPGEDRQERRRCCGMPMWLFVVLMLILVLLIAAAIIVPIVLIVIPHQNHSSSSSTAASCASSLPCQNGGTNILGSDGSCRCLCVNGFTGQTCATASGAGCTTTDIDGTNNATVGDAIPRLLQDAKTNFTIALDGSTILGLFSATNLSCTSENALVTFNGLSERSLEGRSEPAAETAPTKTLLARQDSISATVAAATAAATSNGIVFQSGSPTATASSSAASSSASSDSSLSGATSIDFARVAVLFVLQDSGELNDAISAQEAFTDYFGSGTTETGQRISAQNITLGGGYTADLVTRTVLTGNGTTVGAST
ncbi:hypothetical protein H2203_006343 [Taxawa tesnikishii (nom. ined.)]|nr:hypothetical protein H2203_006343 [Dothideales sp. JES 119]